MAQSGSVGLQTDTMAELESTLSIASEIAVFRSNRYVVHPVVVRRMLFLTYVLCVMNLSAFSKYVLKYGWKEKSDNQRRKTTQADNLNHQLLRWYL